MLGLSIGLSDGLVSISDLSGIVFSTGFGTSAGLLSTSTTGAVGVFGIELLVCSGMIFNFRVVSRINSRSFAQDKYGKF